MNKETWIAIISLTLGSTVITKGVELFLNRNKTRAETHTINIGGEISIGTAWKEYADQAKKDLESLRVDFQKKFDDLGAENIALRARISLLEKILRDNNLQLP